MTVPMLPRRKKPPNRPEITWVRYVVPVQGGKPEASRPIDVYAPPGDPMRAAVCATIVAYLAQPDTTC